MIRRLGRDAALAAASLGAWSAKRNPSSAWRTICSRALSSGTAASNSPRRASTPRSARRCPFPASRREAYKLRAIVACALDGHRTRRKRVRRLAEDRRPATAGARRDGGAPRALRRASWQASCFRRPPRTRSPFPSPSASQSRKNQLSFSAAAPLARASSSVCPDGMVHIPAAETFIGSPRGLGADDEWPRFRTKLAGFCLDKTEVTRGAYEACVDKGTCTNADATYVTCTAGRGHADDLPINCVDAKQAAAFCAARGPRASLRKRSGSTRRAGAMTARIRGAVSRRMGALAGKRRARARSVNFRKARSGSWT